MIPNALDCIRKAYHAGRLSLDPSTQCGAVLVDMSGNILRSDCNRFPQRVERTPQREERDARLRYTIHAEQSVLLSAARFGISTEGRTLVAPWAACCVCAKSIIHAGITQVVAHQDIYLKTPLRWLSDIGAAIEMLREAGVSYTMIEGFTDSVIRFDGKDIRV